MWTWDTGWVVWVGVGVGVVVVVPILRTIQKGILKEDDQGDGDQPNQMPVQSQPDYQLDNLYTRCNALVVVT